MTGKLQTSIFARMRLIKIPRIVLGFFTAFYGVISQARAEERAPEPELYIVNFTAEWCPNCVILDPALDQALAQFDDPAISHIVLDMTDGEQRARSFNRINGTILGGVYGDYVGLTGLVVMVAADSGEKIDCATRVMAADAIAQSIAQSLIIVRTRPVGTRESDSILCPPVNQKIRVQ